MNLNQRVADPNLGVLVGFGLNIQIQYFIHWISDPSVVFNSKWIRNPDTNSIQNMVAYIKDSF